MTMIRVSVATSLAALVVSLAVTGLAAAQTPAPAQAKKPTAATPAKAAATAPATPEQLIITKSNDWQALVVQGQRGKLCYSIAKPRKLEPPGLAHGDVFFFVQNRPKENVRNEPSLQVGYSMKEGSKVTVKVDATAFTMFTRNDGAWMENPADEPKLIEAMRKGKNLTIAATSGRGNPTSYAFQLAGIGTTIDAAAKECGK